MPGEALVLSAIDAGRLDAAGAVARLMRLSSDPTGALYEAVIALETGDEPRAPEAAAASPTPRTLVLDRNGELVATLDAAGSIVPEAETVGLLAGVLERLPPVANAGAVRLAPMSATLDLQRRLVSIR